MGLFIRKVYSWGGNKYGKLGIGNNEVAWQFIPSKLKLTEIKSIQCGANHSLALNQKGEVFSWGSGESGELGNNSTSNSSSPVQVVFRKLSQKIVKIAAGAAHSLFLTSKKHMLSCGDNQYFQTGIKSDAESPHILIPTEIPDLSNIKKIACGDTHSLCLTESGNVFAWGYSLLNDFRLS